MIWAGRGPLPIEASADPAVEEIKTPKKRKERRRSWRTMLDELMGQVANTRTDWRPRDARGRILPKNAPAADAATALPLLSVEEMPRSTCSASACSEASGSGGD